MMFRACYAYSTTRSEAQETLRQWDQTVDAKELEAFLVPAESIRLREPTILTSFINRSPKASAESFHAKLNNFRTVVRGSRDKKCHFFRVAKLYG